MKLSDADPVVVAICLLAITPFVAVVLGIAGQVLIEIFGK